MAGPAGSRSIPLGLPSVDIASRALAEQVKELASERLEASVSDLELADGVVRVAGTDQTVSLAELAQTAEDADTLRADGVFHQDEATYPNGTHVCELEIDPETGTIEILNYTIVDDFGVVVNPLLLKGQVHGGVVQGMGQALMENIVYDEDGQLISASFMDYAMPRAADMPFMSFDTRNVPSTNNAMGIKGAGEAGTIGATPAVMNAVCDALYRACGITHIDMPATPQRVWEAIRRSDQVVVAEHMNANDKAREYILDAAAHLVQEAGVDALTFSDIAEVAEIEQSEVETIFPTLDRLVQDLLERMFDTFIARIGEEVGTDETPGRLVAGVYTRIAAGGRVGSFLPHRRGDAAKRGLQASTD